MKRVIIYLVLFFMFFPLMGQAQHIISLKIGMNQSNIRGDITNYDFNEEQKPFEYNWKDGLVMAIAFQFKLNNSMMIEPEFLFAENGFEQKYNNYYQGSLVSSQLINYQLDYFKFSALLKWYFDSYFPLPDKRISLFTIAGPNLSVLVNAIANIENDLNPLNELELYDFGLTFGAGSAYRLGNSSVSLEVRYYLGFTDTKVFQFFSDYYDISTEVYNKSWEIMLGYSFSLIK